MSRRTPLTLRTASITAENYVCPSCLFQSATRLALRPRRTQSDDITTRARHAVSKQWTSLPNRRFIQDTRRIRHVQQCSNGTLASSTAINAPSTVPHEYRQLHQRLNALQDSASGFVDISRLQLALRSLESSDPVIRIALLGLGQKGVTFAKKLARVLLADALGSEEEWESRLLEDDGDGRSILLKYGEAEDVAPTMGRAELVRTLSIPSPFLKRHGLEIMITGLNGGRFEGEEKRELEGSLLVPSLSMPNSTHGRVGFVRYPVHKALIVGDGVEGAVESARMLKIGVDKDLVGAALNLSMKVPAVADSASSTSGHIVNVDLAVHALDLFRASKANGSQFSNEWEGSRVSSISEWLSSSTTATDSGLKQAVMAQITSTLKSTTQAIDQVEINRTAEATRSTVPDNKRTEVQNAISTWAASAHKDLQLNLTTAFESKSWRRTDWFRLLWRIDDVSYSAADVLRRSWLNETEQSLAFLSGRILESGLATTSSLKESGATGILNQGLKDEMQTYENVKERKESVAELMQMPTMLSRLQEQSGVNALFDPPWPQTISLARAQMLHTLVPAFHRRAQSLLISTLTTIAGTTALGAWLVVATSGVALYEAGAVAALGLVWSLRRLQKKWGKERVAFEGSSRENGRRVLAEVEGHLKKVVSEGGRAIVRLEDVKVWERAREVVESVAKAFGRTKA